MEIPSFSKEGDETDIPTNIVEVEKLLSRFKRLTDGSVHELITISTTVCEKWGNILRVIYIGILDGEVLEDKQIYLSWKPFSGIGGECFSSLEEDGFWRSSTE